MEEKQISFNIYNSEDGFIGVSSEDVNDELDYRETIAVINYLIQTIIRNKVEELDEDNEDEYDLLREDLDEFRQALVENVINTELNLEELMHGMEPTDKKIICNILQKDYDEDNDIVYYPDTQIVSDEITTEEATLSMFQTLGNILSVYAMNVDKAECIKLFYSILNSIEEVGNEYINDEYENIDED